LKQVDRGQSALHSNTWAVDSQHYNQTIGPLTVSTTIKQGVRWAVCTTFKQLGRRQHYLQLGRGQTAPPSHKVCSGQSALHSKTVGRWTLSATFKHLGRGESAPPSNSCAMDRQHHLQKRCEVDSQHCLQTVGPWTDSTTFKQGVQWTVGTAFKELGRGQSALPSNRWAVDSTTVKQGVRWTVSTAFKQMSLNSQHHLQTRCAVDSQHYIQTVMPWTVLWTRSSYYYRHTRTLKIILHLEEGRKQNSRKV
jgi:hypothetical protein